MDCKLITQNLIFGMKTIVFSILYCTRHVSTGVLEHPPLTLSHARATGFGLCHGACTFLPCLSCC